MRVAIDVTPAVRQTAGIGRYTRELTKALLSRGAHDYVLFVADRQRPNAVEASLDLTLENRHPAHSDTQPAPQEPQTAPGGPQEPRYGRKARSSPVHRIQAAGLPSRLLTLLWHRIGLPLPAELWVGKCDVFHATDFLAAPLRHTPAVVTVHDLSFLRHPDRAEPSLRAYLARSVPDAVSKAAHVLADSNYTKAELHKLLGAPPGSVTVAHPGVGPEFHQISDAERLGATRSRYGVEGPFVLGVGTLEPRKDWPTLIRAFDQLGEERRDHELVIVGRRGWLMDGIAEAALASTAPVRLLGYVADEDLPALYSAATAFAYPSLYEGFGLPALEALACGTPTVVSRATSLPEVVGDAALMVPPGQSEELASALHTLLTDEQLRARLKAAGPERAKRFTWTACAEAVEAAYSKAGSYSPPTRQC